MRLLYTLWDCKCIAILYSSSYMQSIKTVFFFFFFFLISLSSLRLIFCHLYPHKYWEIFNNHWLFLKNYILCFFFVPRCVYFSFLYHRKIIFTSSATFFAINVPLHHVREIKKKEKREKMRIFTREIRHNWAVALLILHHKLLSGNAREEKSVPLY